MKKVTAVDITPGSTGWQTVDLTTHFGSDAGNVAGVVLRFYYGSTTAQVAWRKYGANAQSEVNTQRGNNCIFVGCDSSDRIEIYQSATGATFYLIGYMLTDEAVFLDNKVDLSPGSTGWQDIDISSYVTAGDTPILAFFDVVNGTSATTYTMGLRKNGSSVDTAAYGTINSYRRYSACVGVDANNICEFYRSNSNVKLFFVGYMKDNAVAYDFIDKSTANTAVFENVDCTSNLSADATGAFYWFDGNATPSGAVRDDVDNTEDIYGRAGATWGWVPMTNRVFEQKISATTLDLYIVGESQGGSQGQVLPFHLNGLEWESEIKSFAGKTNLQVKKLSGVITH